ncbi:saccharopine dehydrogenase NADP-binding domain-containing protein [Microbulbifer sp. OS29]|uniref:Saccharopine dehydrogenase NADP-binding domain-containing protein n=1 Tax=Microbulbifer okhotskensis TaxID=2926617 RepID=A0A9X2J7W9_9GAMM|nr:saccharopine dehydrogenase NADP-binding domain-containing protein [Microbulbifer okhotskensis]MCO1334951.1 saccharopine dehydrogenase NADP-binding domain-containing protein [Microbulbifer okhotskensis]
MVNNLNKRVLILGGYGNFGARIAQMLKSEPNIQLIIAGHNKRLADRCAEELGGLTEGLRLERDSINLASQLKALHLDLLIHCAGPFQRESDYRVAKACIESRTPYIDISDARRFVCDFHRLSPAAEAAGIAMVSGASSLPGLSSAALVEIQRELPVIHSVEAAIAPAHKIERGLATVRSGFESLGESFPQLREGRWRESFSGNHLRSITLAHPVGKRWLCDFEVPDLELCPRHLPDLTSASFATGTEPLTLQAGLSLCAHLSRLQLPATSSRLARIAHKFSARWPGGSPHGGMIVRATGENVEGKKAARQWQILGLDGDGVWIPPAPAVAMARKFLRGEIQESGARACWQLLSLDEILLELKDYSIITAIEFLSTERHSLPALVAS